MSEELPKKKRGRPPKTSVTTNDSLNAIEPLLPTMDRDSELNVGRSLLDEMIGMSKIKFLLDKPDVLLFGLYDYYEIIDQPLWLNEVVRKLNNNEYDRLGEITDDVKLILENSCRFWGRNHKFIKQVLRVEKLMNRLIKELPEPLKTDGLQTEVESVSSCELPFKTEDFHSEILEEVDKKVWKRTLRAPSADLLAWEREMFESKMNEIRVIPELAEIGQFLSLAKETLYLKQITQYEVERMLLLSHESLTLANVMTSLLCPTALRTILYNKPVMAYEVWSSLLRKKMDIWYSAYSKCTDKLQMFLRYGIEMSFWDSLGDINPFINHPEFEEMPLATKAVILKALCDVMFHTNKKMEDNFNAMDETKLREVMNFEDSKYKYYSMFRPEIRVYRVPKNDDEISPFSFQSAVKSTSMRSSQEKKSAFYLVAWNKKSLSDLIRDLSKKKKSLSSMHKLLSESNSEELTMLAIQGMWNQWKKTKNNENFIDSSISYWLTKTGPSKPQETKVVSVVANENVLPDDSGGRRLSKRKLQSKENEGLPWYGRGDLPAGGKMRRSSRHVERLPSFFTHKLERLKLFPDNDDLNCRTPESSLRGRKRRLSSWLLHLRPSLQPHRKAIDILRAAVERNQSPQAVDSDENVLTVSISSSSKDSEDSNSNDHPPELASYTPFGTPQQLELQFPSSHKVVASNQRNSFNLGAPSPGRALHIPVIENANDLFEGSTPGEYSDVLCIDTLQPTASSCLREIQVGE